MIKARNIEICFWRFITTCDDVIESKIKHRGGIPSDWSVDDICDWVEGRWGDLLEQGWEFGFKFVS